ncbi:thiamine pyrophosphate-dependent dehydrogenase E1 component subunit alpha [Mucilaginibacter limnophilus]|uniref:thiamine pyrophosphate-dependent dehydrogenase E1 component subunit alpha n=1 Tax=Mucilaginibacter limnophilus TaxID=1932778 RepID=UPI001F0C52B3|nr:thiamine pyrophosphate-dependent dehydrogenase E1 component subunit alpha [Mucilaginibacter limnophilus]
MIFDSKNLNDDTLLAFYKRLLLPRMVEEKMLILLRQGRIGKWFSGIGQEAIAVGSTLAMQPDEYILPMHRNLGVFTTRDIPLWKLMAQWQGKATGFTKGRDRSFHFGSQEHKIIGMISHLGPQMALADGIALADKLSGRKKATLVFTGEGATSEGDFHEAINVAAVWDLPVIFLIENNGYGLSTPTREQYRCRRLVDRAIGYGIEGRRIDGNNLLDVYHNINEVAHDIRQRPRPVLLECVTFRIRGHEEASGTKYVPQRLLDEWKQKDPIENFEQYLINGAYCSRVPSMVCVQDLLKILKLKLKKRLPNRIQCLI